MKKIGIQELLTWAFCNELPKAGMVEGAGPSMACGSAGFAEFAELGTIIDRSPNAFGVIPMFSYEGEPHDDAVKVGQAVRALDEHDFEIAANWNPFADWKDDHGLIAAETSRIIRDLQESRNARLNGRQIVSLVTSCAVLKRGPDWSAVEPRVVPISHNGKDPAWFVKRRCKDSLGRPMDREVDGFDYQKRRPVKGAYHKYRLDGSIIASVLSRLEYQIWQSALETLCERLSGRLEAHDLLPFRPVRQPWLTGRKAASEIGAIDFA